MSLTLPPLRTPTAANGANSQAASIAGPEAPARDRHSVEQIIMSMPFLDKVKNLRRIAPPMGAVSATQTADSKPNSTRGALVAVEGRNRKAVDSLAAWLGDLLEKSGDHNVDLMDGPKVPNGWDKVNIADYNAVIGEWHQRNKTIMDFLQHSSKIDDAGSDENENDDDATEDARSDDGEPSPTKNVGKASASDSIPVIVLKTYQLHACDRYACSIPITDVYRPPDHWLWMATLWRGILGADITIYVREIDTSSQSAAVAGESGDKPAPIGNGNAATAAAMEKEREKIGTVDIVEEEGLKCLVVHKEKGKDVEERALRRLGFELGEWVRGIANAGRK